MEPTDRRYRPRAGTVYGCVAMALLLLVGGFVLYFLAFGGHCSPDPQCREAAQGRLLRGALILLLASAVVGNIVRRAINWLSPRLPPNWPPALRGLLFVLLTGLVLCAAYQPVMALVR
jgi:hypothetical protein